MEHLSTKDKIINTALELFSQKGYKGTTTSEIAKKAGVNELTIFRNFGNKKGVLLEAYKARLAELGNRMKFVPGGAVGDLEQDLQAISRFYLNTLSQSMNVVMLILYEPEISSDISKLFLELPVNFKNLLVSYFTEMRQSGKTNDTDPEEAAIAFIAMNLGFILLKNRFGNRLASMDIPDYIRHSVEIFSRGLTPRKECGPKDSIQAVPCIEPDQLG